MRNKINSAKDTVRRNKVGIVFVGTVVFVYGSLAVMSYYNYQTISTQYDLALLNSTND